MSAVNDVGTDGSPPVLWELQLLPHVPGRRVQGSGGAEVVTLRPTALTHTGPVGTDRRLILGKGIRVLARLGMRACERGDGWRVLTYPGDRAAISC